MERVTYGRHTYGMQHITFLGHEHHKQLQVGSFCSLANFTVFLGEGHHTEWVSTFPFGAFQWANQGSNMATHKGGVVIGNDVWIASGATLMSGVTIGDGAVVAANSHVCKDVPPYAMVGGNPARVIKMRFPEPVVERLLHLKWWDLPDEAINRLAHLLCSPNVEGLLDALAAERQLVDGEDK